MKLRVFLAFSLAVGTSSLANAKLGETVIECNDRYGDPIIGGREESAALAWYRKGAYFIMCNFLEGKCSVMVFYRVGNAQVKHRKSASEAAEHMGVEEVKAIVESMDGAHGERWRLTEFKDDPSGNFTAEYRSGFARAAYTETPALIIYSHEHEKRRFEEQRESLESEIRFLK